MRLEFLLSTLLVFSFLLPFIYRFFHLFHPSPLLIYFHFPLLFHLSYPSFISSPFFSHHSPPFSYFLLLVPSFSFFGDFFLILSPSLRFLLLLFLPTSSPSSPRFVSSLPISYLLSHPFVTFFPSVRSNHGFPLYSIRPKNFNLHSITSLHQPDTS